MNIKEGFIICNTETKKYILSNTRDIKNYMFLSFEELKEKLSFSVDSRAILKLMQKYNFSYSLAKEYINALKKIEDKHYGNVKLDSVVSVYRFLLKEDLIKKDELFLHKLKQFPVTFVNPTRLKEYYSLKTLVEKYTSVYEYSPTSSNSRAIVYEFKTIEDEALFIFNNIKKLLIKGVNPSSIHLVNLNDDYIFLFKRLADNYDISINFSPVKNILSANIIKNFLSKCRTSKTFLEALEGIDSKNPLYPTIVDTINKYSLINLDPSTCIEFLKGSFKESSFKPIKYKNAIEITNINSLVSSDDYVFYLNFNLGSAPQIYKEEGFLNDNDLSILNYSPSYEKTILAEDDIKAFVKRTNNLTITYKLAQKTNSFIPSLLIEKLGLEVKHYDNEYGYSNVEDDLLLAAAYDNYLKYGFIDENLKKYGLNNIRYKEYDHKYKQIPAEIIDKHFSSKQLKLAYSNVKLYFNCPFSYYADRILNLNDFKPQMAARLGTYAHAVLEDSYKENFDFNESILRNKLEYYTDAKDEFFFRQMESVIGNLLQFNKAHEEDSLLDQVKTEEHITIVKTDYLFEGYIDKLMYKIDGNDVYACIVDYKTGQDTSSLDNIEDGLNLQLPSYMYLLANYPPFEGLNLHILGIYLQKVNIVIFDKKSSVESQIEKQFKLDGFTVADIGLIKMLDPTFEKSTYIKSMMLTKSGFGRYAKVYQPNNQEVIINMVDSLISKAAQDIKKGKFNIAPKQINNKNVSCTFCKYKDICFYDYNDLVPLASKPFGKDGK